MSKPAAAQSKDNIAPWRILWWLTVFPLTLTGYLLTGDAEVTAWCAISGVVLMGAIGILIGLFKTYVEWMKEQVAEEVQKQAAAQVQDVVETWENERERES